jgi:phospholipase/lecithinase/hemolysin
MTRSLLILGDSLMDSGNIDQVARTFGQDPFEEAIYNGGGNRKASDGPVLGEHIARLLGANLKRNVLANLQTLPGLTLGGFGKAQLRTYAYAGALSGRSGSSRSGLGAFPLGLRSQVNAVAATTTRRESDLDALIGAGSNDLIDLVEEGTRLRRVLATVSGRDDRRLQKRTAKSIVRNIRASRDALTGVVDEVVMVGISPLSETPYLQAQARQWGGALADPLLDWVDGAARRVNSGLAKAFAGQKSTLVVDGTAVWNAVANPVFLDDVHPASASASRLAEQVVAAIEASSLRSFGF